MTNETQKLRVIANSFFPYVTIDDKRKGNDRYHGPAIEILEGLSNALHFDYEIKKVDEQGRFDKNNKTWSGAMGRLIKNESDIAAMPFMINKARYDYVWYTPHIMAQDITILAAEKKGEVAQEISFVAPMFFDVWLGVFLTILVVILIYFVIRVAEKNLTNNKAEVWYLLCKPVAHFFGVMAGEGVTDTKCIFEADKVLVGFFWIFAIIVSYWYQGFLSANMVISDDDGRINTMSDLAEKPGIKPLIIKGTAVVGLMEASEESDFQAVWDNIRKWGKNMSIISGKKIYGLDKFTEVMNQESVIIAGRMSSDFKLAQQCGNLSGGNFYFADESFFPHFIALAASPSLNATLRENIQFKMRRMDEGGVILQMFERIKYQMPVCITEESDTSFSALDITGLLQAVGLLIVGYVLGVLILFIEVCRNCGKDGTETQKIHRQSKSSKEYVKTPNRHAHLHKAVPFLLGVRATTGHLTQFGKRRYKNHNFSDMASTSSAMEYDPVYDYEACIRLRYPKYYQ